MKIDTLTETRGGTVGKLKTRMDNGATNANRQGYQAYFEGKDLAHNPYFDGGVVKYDLWDSGWKAALKDKKKKNADKRKVEVDRCFVDLLTVPYMGGDTATIMMKSSSNKAWLKRSIVRAAHTLECKKCGKEGKVTAGKIHHYFKDGFVCWDCTQKGKKEIQQAVIALAKRDKPS